MTQINSIQDHSFLRVPVVLHTISSFKKEVLEKSATLVLQGLNKCIKEPEPLRNEIMASPDFWVILRNLTADVQAAPKVFEILEGVVTGSPSTITADNYESSVALLNEFATAGSIGAHSEQHQERRSRRGQQPASKQTKPG